MHLGGSAFVPMQSCTISSEMVDIYFLLGLYCAVGIFYRPCKLSETIFLTGIAAWIRE